MEFDELEPAADQALETISHAVTNPGTYTQLVTILVIYLFAFLAARRLRQLAGHFNVTPEQADGNIFKLFVSKLLNLIFPLIAILLLRIFVEISQVLIQEGWLMRTALTVAILLLCNSIINDFVRHRFIEFVAIDKIARQQGQKLGQFLHRADDK